MGLSIKALIKKPWVTTLGAFLAAAYIGFVYRTSRWRKIDWHYPEAYWREKKPFIVCFWHNRLLMTCFAWQGPMPFHMLISAHGDGQLIAKTVGHYGIFTIPGSTSKGGTEALRAIMKTLKKGGVVGITPDGPRGPRFSVSEGTMTIAKLSGLDVLPVTFATSRRKILGSWDRFVLALPFSKGVLAWGAPIRFSDWQAPDAKEKFQALLQERLTALSDYGDTECGVEPIKK